MATRVRKNRCAFSFVELMVVLAIVALLMGLLLGAIQQVRGTAHRLQCQNNLRQLAIALHTYNNDGRPALPAGLSWMVNVLPYIEQDALYQQSLAAQRSQWLTYVDPPHAGAHTVIRLYTCPSDSRLQTAQIDPDGFLTAFSSYLGLVGGKAEGLADGFFSNAVGLRLSNVHDGLSNTLMVGERPPPDTLLAGRWYSNVLDPRWQFCHYRGPDQIMYAYYAEPEMPPPGGPADCIGPFRFGPGRTENPCDRWHFWSLHSGGANFAFCDGSVRFLSYRAEPVIVPLATCNGGETVDLSQFD